MIRATSPKPKKRTCANRACRNKFAPDPRHPFVVACCEGCKIILAKRHIQKAQAAREKKERKELKARKEAVKTRSDWLKEAQIAFNAYIRERDRSKGCISCGASLRLEAIGGGYDCGHYRSVGSAPHLRFDERNAAGQCKKCNRYGAGRAVDYRIVLMRRLGLAAVEALESDNTPRKWTIEDLKQIKATYRAKLKALKMSKGEA